jgi:hypothetical protein
VVAYTPQTPGAFSAAAGRMFYDGEWCLVEFAFCSWILFCALYGSNSLMFTPNRGLFIGFFLSWISLPRPATACLTMISLIFLDIWTLQSIKTILEKFQIVSAYKI